MDGIRAGLLTGLIGAVVSFTVLGSDIEERFGLQLLFTLRGARTAPPSVAIIGMDEQSADFFDLPRDTRKWPRSLHAQLIGALRKAGAQLIVFDIIFKDQTPEDLLLAQAIRDAGNVVLVESVEEEKRSIVDSHDEPPGQMTLMRRIPPTETLAQESLAFAPFTLPKVPGKVSQFWTFQDQLEDQPTLPTLLLQLYASSVWEDLLHLIQKAHRQARFTDIEKELGDFIDFSDEEEPSFRKNGMALQKDQIHSFIRGLKRIFEKNTALSEWMLEEVKRIRYADRKREALLEALIHLYSEGKSRYIDFYGPPRTITTIPFFQALSPLSSASSSRREWDLDQKVVFVGASSTASLQQKDSFYTPFPDTKGIQLSGVEILATAFANLLEDRPIRTLKWPFHLLLILGWGIVAGLIWTRFRPLIAVTLTLALILGYLAAVYRQFLSAGLWLPIIVPAFLQTSIAGSGSLILNYLRANQDRKNIRAAFGLYLPNRVVDQISSNLKEIRSSGASVHGSCLYTDIENYTALSEAMSPDALHRLMNDYYDAIFSPIHRFGGDVIDLRGDAMLAIWAESDPDPKLKTRACTAALSVAGALREFNLGRPDRPLYTRIGLHFGPLFLGNVGGTHHLEYRAVGDIVNTASRIEGLNKLLRTQLLVSEEMMTGQDDFITRSMGIFSFPGKSIPLKIYELIGKRGEIGESVLRACSDFSRAVDLYGNRQWPEAKEIFTRILQEKQGDGPSLFYIQLCEQRMASSSVEPWSAVIRLEKER